MTHRFRLLTLLLVLTFLSASCGKENMCSIPIGNATCTLFLDMPDYYPLRTVGGSVNIIGGNRGVTVIRLSINEFAAYERTCPHDHDATLEVEPGSGGAVLLCPVCGSRFSTYAEGAPIDGSVTSCSLYRYSTSYDGLYTLSIW